MIELVEDRANRAWHVLASTRCRAASSRAPSSWTPAVRVTSGRRRNVSRRGRPELVAADPDHHGRSRRRAGDALRHHRRARACRGLAGPGQHRFRRAVRGAGHRSPPARAGRPVAAGPSPVRAALARPDQGDQPRGPQSAPGARRARRRPSPGSCSTTGGPWLETAAARRWRAAAAGGCPLRPRPPARPDASSARRSCTSTEVRRALVVGDPRAEPQPGFAALPGAREEAPGSSSGCAPRATRSPCWRATRWRPSRWWRRCSSRPGPSSTSPPTAWSTIEPCGTTATRGARYRDRARRRPRSSVPRSSTRCRSSRRSCSSTAAISAASTRRPRSRRRPSSGSAADLGRQRRRAAGPHGRARRGGCRLGGRRHQCRALRRRFYEEMLAGRGFGDAVRLGAPGRSIARAATTRPGVPTSAMASRTGGWSEVVVAEALAALIPSLAEAVAMAEQINEAAQVGLDRDQAAPARRPRRAESGPPAHLRARSARAAG